MVLNINQRYSDGAVFDPVSEGRTTPYSTENGTNIRQIPSDTWSCSFTKVGTGLITDDFYLYRNTISGGASLSQSSGSLVMAAGTTANEEILMRSVRSFHGSLNLRVKSILSQRIVNNNFTVELADEIGRDLPYVNTDAVTLVVSFAGSNFPFKWDAANIGQSMNVGGIKLNTGTAIPGRYAISAVDTVAKTLTFTVASWGGANATGTLTLYGWNYIRNLYSGATSTNAAFDTQRYGWNTGDSTVTINTTASPGHVAQIKNDGTMVAYSDALVASNTTATQFTSRGNRIENIPEDTLDLYLWIHSTNGSTAPLSNTTWTIGFVRIEMMGCQRVWTAGAIQDGANGVTPVAVVSAPSTTVTASNLSCNVAQINGVTPLMGNGVTGTGSPRVTLASDGTAISTAGYMSVKFDQTTFGTTNLAAIGPSTLSTSACSVSSQAALGTPNIKASAGNVYGISIVNKDAAVLYIQFYNTAGTPTRGTSVVWWIPVPASATLNIPPGSMALANFSTGIGIAGATTATGSGAPTTAPDVVVYYK